MNLADIKESGICPITGWKAQFDKMLDSFIYYEINCQIYRFVIAVSPECFRDEEIKKYKNLLGWLFVKNKLPVIKNQSDLLSPSKTLITPNLIKQVLSETYTPKTPEEKYDQLLIDLYNLMGGSELNITKEKLLLISFFENEFDLSLYLDALTRDRYISIKEGRTDYSMFRKNVGLRSYAISPQYEGLSYINKILKSGINSDQCFIAMSFSGSEKSKYIRDAIKRALIATRYTPVIIDENKVHSEKTINDAIISEIKRAKFVIADFTEQKNGVYFEAGYALGRGLQVLYCCDKEDFEKNAHFDVNHYPHILHSSPDELELNLINKIKAWID